MVTENLSTIALFQEPYTLKNVHLLELLFLGQQPLQLFKKEQFIYKEEIFYQDLKPLFSDIHDCAFNALMKTALT